ncbi:MAG: ATP-binding protein [Myxococcaceae bacterium]
MIPLDELAQDAHRLRALLRWLLVLSLVFAGVDAVGGLVSGYGGLLVGGAVLAGFACAVVVAQRLVRARRVEASASVVAYGLLLVAVVSMTAVRFARPTLLLVPPLGLALALPYLGKRQLRWLGVASFLSEALVVVIGEWVKSYELGIPLWIRESVLVSSVIAGAFLLFAVLAQFASRLRDALEASRRNVQELTAASERERLMRQRVDFLAEAGAKLATSLNLDETLQRVANLALPFLGDFCLVDVVDEGGALRRVASAHRNPEHAELLARLHERFPPSAGSPAPAGRVLATGAPELLEEVDPSVVAAHSGGAEHGELIRRLGIRSHLAVPLKAYGRLVGVMNFAITSGERRFGKLDLQIAEELARRAAAAIENARLYEEATRAVAIREEFMSIASHELRTPLTALSLQLQLLQRTIGSANVERASTQAKRLGRLVDQLLDVSRVTRGSLELEPEETDLRAVCEDIVAQAAAEAEHAGVKLALECEAGLRAVLDPSRLEQILVNLLNNAIKYGAGRPVRISVEALADKLRLSVIDQGPGIAQEEAAVLFQPFSRLSSARNIAGLGLGLYISRRIAEQMGGALGIVSEPGRGSTFVLELPLGSVESRLSHG